VRAPWQRSVQGRRARLDRKGRRGLASERGGGGQCRHHLSQHADACIHVYGRWFPFSTFFSYVEREKEIRSDKWAHPEILEGSYGGVLLQNFTCHISTPVGSSCKKHRQTSYIFRSVFLQTIKYMDGSFLINFKIVVIFRNGCLRCGCHFIIFSRMSYSETHKSQLESGDNAAASNWQGALPATRM
jgi:hypothetical protein